MNLVINLRLLLAPGALKQPGKEVESSNHLFTFPISHLVMRMMVITFRDRAKKTISHPDSQPG